MHPDSRSRKKPSQSFWMDLVRYVSVWIIPLEDSFYYLPLDTERTFNVHKTFRGYPGRLLNVLMYVKFTSYVQRIWLIDWFMSFKTSQPIVDRDARFFYISSISTRNLWSISSSYVEKTLKEKKNLTTYLVVRG